jgi:uncharacterized protein YuzE
MYHLYGDCQTLAEETLRRDIKMRLEYDPEADALYLRLKKGRVSETVEIAENVFVDLDAGGEPLGIEILFVSKRYPSEELASVSVHWLKRQRTKSRR